jgi:DNA primase
MQPRPTARSLPILEVAAALGLQVDGHRAHCFNTAGHKGGNDAHPSLKFFPEVNGYKCYACGAKGDVIGLVRAVRGVGFGDAVKWLEDQFGGTAGKTTVPNIRTVPRNRTPDEQAVKVYTALWTKCFELRPTFDCAHYLRKRGLTLTLAKRHDVAALYDSREVWGELIDEFGADRLRAAGLMSESDRFLFAGHRLLFYYYDGDRPVYLQARDVTGRSQCKELSPAGLHSPVPYNVNLLREKLDEVYVCEGCIDTLSALQMGYPAVGVPGVTGFRDEWFDRFRSVGQVYILFDNDAAGQRYAVELRAQFRMRGIRADVYHPRGVKDMNDLLLKTVKGKA